MVNAEKPHTYKELDPEERKAVRVASRWKDTNCIADKVYSALGKVGKFARATLKTMKRN